MAIKQELKATAEEWLDYIKTQASDLKGEAQGLIKEGLEQAQKLLQDLSRGEISEARWRFAMGDIIERQKAAAIVEAWDVRAKTIDLAWKTVLRLGAAVVTAA